MKLSILKSLMLLVALIMSNITAVAQTTWAVKNSGDWSNYNNWTLDLSGQSYINDGNNIPSATDNVVIPAGKEIVYGGTENLQVAKMTVEGQMTISNEGVGIDGKSIDGSGLVKVPSTQNLNFADATAFRGTWEVTGDNTMPGGVLSSVIISSGTQTITGDMTIAGDVVIGSGANVILAPGITVSLNNLTIEEGGSITSNGGEGADESALHITGDFINRGTVVFCEGERAAKNETKSKRVLLYFEGDGDGTFSAEGTTTLYRLICDKGITATQTVVAPGGITMLGRTVDMGSYKNLPWVPQNGILKLGDGVNIEHWAEVYRYYDTPNYFAAGNMYIPENATLWIAGANVRTGVHAYPQGNTEWGEWGEWADENENGFYGEAGTLYRFGSILIAGTLKITSGTLKQEDYSGGVYFVKSLYGEETTTVSSNLLIDGGVIETNHIACWSDDKNVASRAAVYNQTGGELRLNKKICYNPNELGIMSQSMYLGSGSKFLMSGGSINISVPIPSGAGNAIRGIFMADSDKMAIESNVSGGEIKIFGSDIDLFQIYMPFNLNNLTVSDGAKVEMKVVGGMSQYSTLMLNGDLSVLGSSSFSTIYDVNLGGSLTIDAGASFSAKSDGSGLSTLTLNGKNNGTYTDLSGQAKWSNLIVSKQGGAVTVSDGSKITVTKEFSGVSGSLVGAVEFTEALAQKIAGNQSCLSGVDLLVNKTGGSITLNNDVALNSVHFEQAHLFELGDKNLRLNEYPTSSVGWSTSTCFSTDDSHTAGGLTLPVPAEVSEDNVFPFGCSSAYSPVQPLYTRTAEGQMLTVVQVHGTHPNASSTDSICPMYWRITSDVESTTAGKYKCTTHGFSSDATSLMVKSGGVWNTLSGDVAVEEGGSVIFEGCNTSGDFVVGDEDKFFGGNEYVCAKSGNWNDAIWYKNGDTSVMVSGSEITVADNVVIPAGFDVSSENGLKAKDIFIGRDGESVAKLSVNLHSTNTVSSFSGSGVLEYLFSGSWGWSFIGADYSEFMCNDESLLELNNTSQSETVWLSGYLNQIKEFSNLTLSGSASFGYQLEFGSEFNVRGDLECNTSFEMTTHGSGINVGGSFVNKGQFVMNVHNNNAPCKFNSIYNYSSISSSSQFSINVTGNIVNNGEISLPNAFVVFTGETGVGADVCTVSGSSTDFGKTYFGYLTVDKEFEDCRVRLDIPVGDSNGLCKIELLKGRLHLNYSSDLVTVYKAFEAQYTWGGVISGHIALEDFHIPETCEIIVDNGCKLRLWCPTAQSPDCHRVELGGGLKLLGGAEVSVNNAESGADNEGGYSGFAYTSSLNSNLYMGDNTKLTAAFLTSYTADAIIDLEMTSGATIDIVPSTSIYGSYGAFDVRGGKVSMVDKSVININNATTNSFPSLYYNPVTSNIGKAKFNILTDKEPFVISAYSALGSLNVADVATAELYDNELVLGGDFTVAGAFDSKGYDVEVSGDMSVSGTYTPSGNVTRFVNGEETQRLSTTDPSLELFGFESSAAKLVVDCKTSVTDDFTVTSGEVALGDDMSVAGDVLIEYKSKVSGSDLMLKGSKVQFFDCEGTIENLTIDNVYGVNSSRQQANPIVVTKQLTLSDGVFSIGGNLLELCEGATIAGTNGFSRDCMVATFNSPTDRGIRVCMKAGATYSMLLPFGEASKYTPIELKGLKSSTTGSITFVPNNDIEPSVSVNEGGNYLHFYWTVKAADVNVTAGEFVCHGLKSDAVGYSAEKYVTAYLNLSNGKWCKAGGDVAAEDDNILLTFAPCGSSTDIAGRYTAGKSEDLPDALMTYIADKTGKWSSAIWRVYDVDAQQAIGEYLTPASMSGCGIIIDAGVTVTMGADDNNIRMSSIVLREGSMLNVGSTRNNQIGYISGTGTLKVEAGDAMPSGVYDDFLEVGGGTIEYGGTSDYNVFVTSVYVNNVKFSGTGNRVLRSDADIQVNGDMMIEGATVVFSGKNVTLLGDLTINNGHATGTGSLVFAGSLQQQVTSTEDITLSGVQIYNANGVTTDCSMNISQLILTKGILSLADGKKVKITSDATDAVVGGSSTSYVEGIMTRKLSSGTEYKFPVGNEGRYGEAGVLPSASGEWRVAYINATPPDFKNRDSKVTALGSEYWEVLGPTSAEARVRVRWDSQSGTFTSSAKMATYDDKWNLIECNSPVGETMLAVAAVTNKSEAPRLYTVATVSTLDEFTWTGAEDERWENVANWVGAEVPSISSDVVIPSGMPNDPIISSVAYCNNMEIKTGATLILFNTGYFSVGGTITNNGSFVMFYDYDANPSFVYSKDMDGEMPIIERNFIPNKLTYTGSATKEGTVTGLSQSGDLMRKMTAGENCVYTNGDNSCFDGVGKGNDVKCVNIDGTARVLKQQGTLVKSNEPISVQLGEGWNFVSNPYPYSVSLDKLIADNDAIDPTVWVRTYDFSSGKYCWITRSTDLKTQTGVGDISVVSAFQGIHIYAEEATMLEFNPTALSVKTGVGLKSVESEEIVLNELRLTVASDDERSYVDEVVILFDERGDMNLVDGESKKNMNSVAYSTIATAKEGEMLTIACYPEAQTMEGVEIPLVVNRYGNAGSLIISAASIANFNALYDVYLVDKYKDVMVNLRETDYEITDFDVMSDRFFVVLNPTVTDKEEATAIESVENRDVAIYAVGNTIVVEANDDVDGGDEIRVYDIAGREVVRMPMTMRMTRIQVAHSGIYIVKIADKHGKVVVE